MSKNCDSCIDFVKVNFNDGRKGICEFHDASIADMKGKPCKDHSGKRYERRKGTYIDRTKITGECTF